MQNSIHNLNHNVISNSLLRSVNGGAPEEPKSPTTPTVIVFGGGGTEGAGGTVIVTFPVGPSTTVSPFVNADTNNGVTGGGASVTFKW